MNYYSLSSAINALTAIGLALFVLIKSTRQQVHRAFVYFAITAAAWASAYLLWQLSLDAETALFWSRALMVGAIYAPITYLHFTIAFLGEYKKKRTLLYCSYALFTVFLLFNFTPLFVSHVEPFLGFMFWPMPGPVFHVFLAIWFGYLFYTVSLLIKYYKKASTLKRNQLNYIFLGIFIAFLGGSTNYLPWYKISLPPYGNILVAVYLLIFAYAITVRRLLDIDILIRRGLVFSILFTSVTVIFNIVITVLRGFFPSFASNILAALFITFTFAPLKKLLENATDHFLFQKRYKLDETLNHLHQILLQSPRLKDLVGNILQLLINALRIEGAAAILMTKDNHFIVRMAGEGPQEDMLSPLILIQALQSKLKKNTEYRTEIIEASEIERELHKPLLSGEEQSAYQTILQELKRGNFSVVVPLTAANQMLGILLIRDKKSRDPFTQADFQLLDIVSHEVTSALEAALNVEQILEIDELKSEFIRIVSHQLRTPLTTAKWNSELMLAYASTAPPKQKEIIQSLYSGLTDLSNGLNDLITALDITEQKELLAKQKIRFVKDIIFEVKKNFSPQLKEKKIKLVIVKADKKDAELSGDKGKLRRVLSVLLLNAIQYSPPATTITVSMAKKGNHLEVGVKDEGMGVPLEYRKKIFEKFFRGEKARYLCPNGLGIGLYIARAFIEQHGGHLYLAPPQDGQPGSEFVFTLCCED